MKTPPFLIGAGLLFWGWQADLLPAAAVMAAVLESARFIKARWDLTSEDFSRIWTFCAFLFLAVGAYAFTSNNGPASFGNLFTDSSFSARNAVGSTTSKTAVLMIRWLPMAFFLFIAAQTFCIRDGIPLESISLIVRRRRRRAQESGQPLPPSRMVNVTYPYFIACLFAASSHPPADDNKFFWGLCTLVAWALWPCQSRRFGRVTWGITMGLAILMGQGGARGLVALKLAIEQYNPQWLAGRSQGFDPLESRTEIGQIGRIKTSGQIVIRLETLDDNAPPSYLREAAYRIYRSAVWYANKSNDDFATISEEPVNSGSWPLLRGPTNTSALNIACYLPGGKGLLPLPTESARLEQLPAFLVEKNDLGTVRAEGPGLVIFNGIYGGSEAMDVPPDTNEDINVPAKEMPALDEIISEQHLNGLDREKTLDGVSRFFATKFTYSLWQDPPPVRDTNGTAVGRFLRQTRSGHCEYFATATVLLLRELKIPARYTVGYAVHEASGHNYVVRQNDAHAWCRVWNDAKQRWENFDTTPGSWIGAEQKQRSSFQFLFDAWSRCEFEFSKFRWGQSHLRRYIPWALAPVLALLLYQIIFRSNRRRAGRKPGVEPDGMVRPGLDSEFYQLEQKLAARGLTRHSSETLSNWLRRTATNPELSPLGGSLHQVLLLHYAYRFDPAGLDADRRAMLRREVEFCLSHLPPEK